MNGEKIVDGRRRRVGLNFLRRYWVSPVLSLQGGHAGLPFSGRRIFIILLAKEFFTKNHMLQAIENFTLAQSQCLTLLPLGSWVHDGSSEDEVEVMAKRRKISEVAFPEKAAKGCRAFRQGFGLPKITHEDGQPFSSSASERLTKKLSAYQREVLDIAWLYVQKYSPETDMKQLTVDVSESPQHKPWRTDKRIPSLTTTSKIVFNGKILGYKSLFNMMGWPRNGFVIPDGLYQTDLNRMLGNMLCPPMVGCVLACIFAVERDADGTDGALTVGASASSDP